MHWTGIVKNPQNPHLDWKDAFVSSTFDKDELTESEALEGKPFPNNTTSYQKKDIPNFRADFWETANDLGLEADISNEVEENHLWPIQKIGELITPAQKEILKKYFDWKLDLAPQDWQDLIKERDAWLVSFPNVDFKDKGITPAQIRTKYDEPKESHKPEDLKPADYDNIKNELDGWKKQFGTKKPNEVQAEIDAKPTGTVLGDDQVAVNKHDWETDWSLRPKAVDYQLTQKRVQVAVKYLRDLIKEKQK